MVVLGVAIGGAIGVLSRYGVDRLIEQRTESGFPWSTLVINVTGCLLVGFLVAALVDRHAAPDWLRAALIVGFCGGYTTFSTFAQETVDLLETRAVVLAVLAVAANVSLGIVAVVVGARMARLA